jgi:membrane-associated PAP2 superfamily phosphatase
VSARPARDLAVFIALGAAITIIFAAADLDFDAARFFYQSDPRDPWPLGREMPWALLYRMAPWITAALVFAGLGAVGFGLVRARNAWRVNGIFLLLTLVLGPGVIINLIFKDHWNRPRPRDVIEFGGQLPYAPAPLRGEGGKSFPCGHCSVGYLFAAGFWIWQAKRPYLAATSIVVGLIAGTALGLGRMAAGGHFLSDVVWSAFLALGLAHALYYYVLRVPIREQKPFKAQHRFEILAALGAAGILLALFVLPHGRHINSNVALASLPQPPQVFELSAKSANVEIVLADSPVTQVSASAELHGFGLPTSRLEARSEFRAEPVSTLRYVIEQHGWFTDLDAGVAVRLPAAQFERIVVRLERGNVKVVDATQARVVQSARVQLDLRTDLGSVRITEATP